MNETTILKQNNPKPKGILKKPMMFLVSLVFVFLLFSLEGTVAFAASVKVPTVKSVSASSSSAVTVKWKKVSGVTGYIIYQKKASASYKKIDVVKGASKVSYTQKGLSAATKYTYKIKAYKSKNGKKSYSGYSNAKSAYTRPATPTITSIKSPSKTSVKISWKKVSKVKGYAIYQKIGGEYERVATVKSGSTTSYTIKGLKSGKKYSFVVRSYYKSGSNNIYSAQSSAKSVYTLHTHKYSKKITKPTCTKKGYTTYTCFCGMSYKSDYKNPAHQYQNYQCTDCGEVDKKHTYEYLKLWLLKNGTVDGSFVNIYQFFGDTMYGLSYNANDSTLYISEAYLNTYDDAVITMIHLDDYSYFASIGDNIYDDYIIGELDPKRLTANSPLVYEEYNDTYYEHLGFVEDTRISVCDILYWFETFLSDENVGITIADLGFVAYY